MQPKTPFKSWFDALGYVFFWEISEGKEENLKFALMRCHRGSTGPGSYLIYCQKCCHCTEAQDCHFRGNVQWCKPQGKQA